MIRYRIRAKRAGDNTNIGIALTDYKDIAFLIKETIEKTWPDCRVYIQDLSQTEIYFNPNTTAFSDNGSGA